MPHSYELLGIYNIKKEIQKGRHFWLPIIYSRSIKRMKKKTTVSVFQITLIPYTDLKKKKNSSNIMPTLVGNGGWNLLSPVVEKNDFSSFWQNYKWKKYKYMKNNMNTSEDFYYISNTLTLLYILHLFAVRFTLSSPPPLFPQLSRQSIFFNIPA